MGFKITCTCGRQFGVKDQYAGKKGRCPHCGTSLVLQPDGDSSPAPVAPAKGATPGGATPVAKPPKRPAPAEKVGMRPDPGNEIEIRSGATPTKVSAETGELDVTSQVAGIRHIVQRFCPTCGARYSEGASRCANCHAPLSAEEIAAAAAEKKPPLIPWLPRLHLSTRGKLGVAALIAVLVGVVVYAIVLHAPLQRRSRLKTELTLVEKGLATGDLLWLNLEMPGFPYDRPAVVKAMGKWERHLAAAVFASVGKGTYDLAKRELLLTAVDDGKTYTYRATLKPPLHVAAVAEDTRSLQKMLADPGCNVNETDAHGATALHAAAAAQGDLVESVRLLLDRKADPSIRDNKGMTPLALALSAGNKKVAKVLRGQGAADPARVILLPE
jgi:hypothetical protein